MMKRKAMKRGGSRKHFKKNTGVHKLNLWKPQLMRAGIRL